MMALEPGLRYRHSLLATQYWLFIIHCSLLSIGFPILAATHYWLTHYCRGRRWLAAEMKDRRAHVGNGLLERLAHDPKDKDKLTFRMHWILMDWLVDVAIEFNLSNATLALTSSVLDRFLAVMNPSCLQQ